MGWRLERSASSVPVNQTFVARTGCILYRCNVSSITARASCVGAAREYWRFSRSDDDAGHERRSEKQTAGRSEDDSDEPSKTLRAT